MRQSAARRRALRSAPILVVCLSMIGGISFALAVHPARAACKRNSRPCILLGNHALESREDFAAPGRADAFPFVARRAGIGRSLNVYLAAHSNATVVLAALYSNRADHPGTRVASGVLAAPKAGAWNAMSISPARLNAGKTYWLALLGEGGRIAFRDRARGSCVSVTSAQRSLSSFAGTWTGAGRSRTCSVSAYVTSQAAPRRQSQPQNPGSCTRTLTASSDLNSALETAGNGGTICLAAGTYGGRGEIDLHDIHPQSTLTIKPIPGASVTLGWLNINSMSNVTFRGFNLSGGVSLRGAATNDAFEDNTISGDQGAKSGFFFYGNGAQQSGIHVTGNHIDHLAPSDLSGPGAGQCMTVYGDARFEHNFTFDYNACGPGIANHYTQYGGIDGLAEDHNTFLGPAAAEALQRGEHNNVLQIFADSDNLDFSHNVIRGTDSRGQTVLIQEGHFSNVTVNGNLWVEDPNCRSNSSNCGSYAFGMCAATGLQFKYNTIVDSFAGIQVTNSVLSNSDGTPTGCSNQGSNYTVTHNIVVGTRDNADISYNECVSNCTFDYNVTDDGTAGRGGSKHHVINWRARWTNPTSYQAVGLPFSAGYGP